MGGSSSQVTGYRYFTNLLLFIGNPIEGLIGINFDKRGWISGERAKDGDNGELISIKAQNLYGENEGGVYGVMNLHTGTNTQLPDAKYSQYMSSMGLQASAYPYLSYLSFSGSGKVHTGNGWVDGVFGALAGYMNDAFYVGNSGYMKEMLLWPKRIHVRNNGSEQWYDLKSEIYGGDHKSDIYFDGNFPPFSVDLHRCQGFGDIECFDSVLNSSGGKDNILPAIGAIGIGTQTTNPPASATASFRMLSSVGGFILVSMMVDINGEYHSITAQNESSLVSMDIELIESDIGVKKFKVTAVFNLFKSKIFGFVAVATGATAVDVNQFVLGSRIYNQEFNGISGRSYSGIESPDINPIHKIREIITDDTAMNKPELSVNNVNFMKAADRIFDEELGISWSITEKSCVDAINELCYHIEAGIRVNRQTGLYEMVLFRDDWFDEDEIHLIAENKIKKNSMQYEITNADEVINQVNVNYYDRQNIKNSSFSISENGMIQTLGRVNAETVDFPYFMSMRNAEIVANWKLKILSTGVVKGVFTTGWREARKWNRYDLIRLPWSKRWTGTILVRIMSIKLGGPTNNEVSIEFIEVVPLNSVINSTIIADDPVDAKPVAPQPCNAKVFELPYFEAVQAFGEREVTTELTDNPESGYLCAIAEKPQSNSLNAALHADSGNGFERVATINYCETAYLDQAIDRINSTFVVKNVGNIASIRIGSQIFINDEIMVYQSYDAVTKILTVKRGAFGIPQNQTTDSILYFADDFVAIDQTTYAQSEVVNAKVLTTTPSGVLSLNDAENHDVEIKARAIRPYPPANVKFNGSYFPETNIVTNNIVLTWAHRNRAQQTGGEIIGWYESDVTTENGVTYSYELISENVVLDSQSNIAANTVTILASALKPNKPHTLKLWSKRDGYESYQKFEHAFFVESASLILTATASKDKVVGSTVPLANVNVTVDESLKANMKFDGSSITGKAQAGASITIEVNE